RVILTSITVTALRHSILCLLAGVVWAQTPTGSAAVQEASAAILRGDLADAERRLRVEAAARSADPSVLSLLGVTLDRQGKLREASEAHARAVELLPDSADVLNNYGTHL